MKRVTSLRYHALPLWLATILFVLTGCSKKHSVEQSTEPAAVHVAEATTDSVVLYKKLPGIIESVTTTKVVARVNGKILTQNFTAGQYVRQGQVLYSIESTTYRDAVTQAEASLASAKSQQEYYTQQLAAMRKALEADAVSKMQVVQAESNLRQAEASVRQAQATLSTARDNLSHCTVRAPSSGMISESLIDAGNYVNGEGASVTLATIYDNTNMQATFSLSDTEYEQLIGNTGGITSQLYRNVPLSFRDSLTTAYTANLYYVSPSVDESTSSLRLIGKLTNKNNELRNGMYVSVSLPYGAMPHAVLVKDAALSSDQLGYYLYTVDADNTVHHTPVKVGELYQDSLRIVLSGISPSERYVTKALLKVRSGEKIKPVLTK